MRSEGKHLQNCENKQYFLRHEKMFSGSKHLTIKYKISEMIIF